MSASGEVFTPESQNRQRTIPSQPFAISNARGFLFFDGVQLNTFLLGNLKQADFPVIWQ